MKTRFYIYINHNSSTAAFVYYSVTYFLLKIEIRQLIPHFSSASMKLE